MNQYWTTKTEKLIELLRDHTYLWNQADAQYRNKTTREYGFATIANELNVTVAAVKHKITNLKSKYKAEQQKISSSKQLGFYYKPLLSWFNDFKELMESVEGPRESVPLLSEVIMITNPSRDNMGETSPDEEEDSGEEQDITEEPDNSDTIVVSISQEYIDEVNKEQKNINVAPKSFNKNIRKSTTRKRLIDSSDSVIQDHSDNVIEPSLERPRRDEFQMFAEQIAEQLKTMPIESAMSLQHNIQSLLDEACDTD